MTAFRNPSAVPREGRNVHHDEIHRARIQSNKNVTASSTLAQSLRHQLLAYKQLLVQYVSYKLSFTDGLFLTIIP